MTHAPDQATPHAAAPQGADALDARYDESAPGFYLADDADGRFVIDHDTGVVTLSCEDVLARERNVVHVVRIKVIEQSGESYEVALRLKITGMAPQIATPDEGFAMFDEPMRPAPAEAPAAAPERPVAPPAPFSAARWLRFAAFAPAVATPRETARFEETAFGDALAPAAADNLALEEAALAIEPPPAIAPADWRWAP